MAGLSSTGTSQQVFKVMNVTIDRPTACTLEREGSDRMILIVVCRQTLEVVVVVGEARGKLNGLVRWSWTGQSSLVPLTAFHCLDTGSLFHLLYIHACYPESGQDRTCALPALVLGPSYENSDWSCWALHKSKTNKMRASVCDLRT